MIEAVRRLAHDLPPSPPRVDLQSVLGPMPSAARFRIRLSDALIQRVLVPSEPGLDVPAFLLRPAGEVRGVVVALDDRGKEVLASDPVIATARARGWAVCGVDLRGIGESATDKMGWVFAVSLLLGENFVGRQAWDVGRVLEALGAAGGFPGKPVGLYARGQVACLAATYAIARASEPGQVPLRWYVLRDGFLSYRAWIDRPRSMPESYRLLPEDRDRTTAFDREIPASFFAFNALRSFDLPQLLALSRTEALIVNPVDGDCERLAENVARGLLGRRAGRLRGRAGANGRGVPPSGPQPGGRAFGWIRRRCTGTVKRQVRIMNRKRAASPIRCTSDTAPAQRTTYAADRLGNQSRLIRELGAISTAPDTASHPRPTSSAR